MGEERRHFSREFKRDAVQLVTEKGMPVGKVARELDIHPNLLHLWRRRFLAQGDKVFVGRGPRPQLWQLTYDLLLEEPPPINYHLQRRMFLVHFTTPSMICPVVSPFFTGCWFWPVALGTFIET